MGSSAAVGSSSAKIGPFLYSARASISRWVCPPESSTPSSYTLRPSLVSSPWGRARTASVRPAWSRHCHTRSVSMPSSRWATFSATLASSTEKSWNTAENSA